MEQTAVEWFADRIKHGGLVSKKQFDELLEQAKEMFEKQIGDAWRDAFFGQSDTSKLYYHKTFKSE